MVPISFRIEISRNMIHIYIIGLYISILYCQSLRHVFIARVKWHMFLYLRMGHIICYLLQLHIRIQDGSVILNYCILSLYKSINIQFEMVFQHVKPPWFRDGHQDVAFDALEFAKHLARLSFEVWGSDRFR